MLYKKFVVENFKGIRRAEVRLDPFGAARVYTFVGLNESGKTTLLEAIHSFSPDADTEVVVKSANSVEQQNSLRVPKDKISDFTGDVKVTAEIAFENGEYEQLQRYCKMWGFEVDKSSKVQSFQYSKIQRYKDGEFQGNYYNISWMPQVKTPKQKNFRKASSDQESRILAFIRMRFPIISYFPTFVFEFPDRIYLSKNHQHDQVNEFYRKLFQDILDYGGRDHNIKTHILDRIGKDEYKITFAEFFPRYVKSSDREKIQQVIDNAAKSVTDVIFDKWNTIFNEELSGKEISIDFDIEQAPKKKDANGAEIENLNHSIYLNFFVKDGTNRFAIKDRSLGFRWFFSFLLFTQFRAARSDGRPIVFLLDEPASNLHASAQQKLIESFPQIARGRHTLIYSTHSHYMIQPAWLEQCYIVQNSAGGDPSLPISENATRRDDAYDIVAIPYRQFVSENPKSTSYFQPIIDRLDVVPSRFDIDRGGVIVEGKSDYFILEFLNSVQWKKKLPVVPGLGSGALDALISIHRGWGLPVRVLLDSDEAGTKELAAYKARYFLTDDEIRLLSDFDENLKSIESLIDEEMRAEISKALGITGKLKKKDILNFFQNSLAAGKKMKISQPSSRRLQDFLRQLQDWSN